MSGKGGTLRSFCSFRHFRYLAHRGIRLRVPLRGSQPEMNAVDA